MIGGETKEWYPKYYGHNVASFKKLGRIVFHNPKTKMVVVETKNHVLVYGNNPYLSVGRLWKLMHARRIADGKAEDVSSISAILDGISEK